MGGTPGCFYAALASQIIFWMMALQGCDVEVKCAQIPKIYLGQGLAKCQHCDCEGQENSPPLLVTTPTLPSNHCYHEENVCQDLPKVFMDGCSCHHASQLKAAVSIVWVNETVEEPNQYQPGTKNSQYTRITAMLITLQQTSRMT